MQKLKYYINLIYELISSSVKVKTSAYEWRLAFLISIFFNLHIQMGFVEDPTSGSSFLNKLMFTRNSGKK
jgi:hypothetical protein